MRGVMGGAEGGVERFGTDEGGGGGGGLGVERGGGWGWCEGRMRAAWEGGARSRSGGIHIVEWWVEDQVGIYVKWWVEDQVGTYVMTVLS